MLKRLVMIDIDGVLFPWTDAANLTVMEAFGVPDPGPHLEWYHLRDQLTASQYSWVWSNEGQRAIFSKLLSYPEAEGFRQLLDHPWLECHFVTHRKPSVLGVITAEYLSWLFPDSSWDGLHVINDKCIAGNKADLLDWDFAIDDKPDTVIDFMNSDAMVFVPRRPWNEELEDTRLVPDVYWSYYTDSQEVVDRIMEYV